MIDQIFPNSAINNYLKTRSIYEYFTKEQVENPTPFYELFQNQVNNTVYKNSIDRVYNKMIKLKEGATAPEIVSTDANGQTIKLSDFKGKYVYIDVWATWCKPCVKEMPIFNQLKSDFKGQNIVFWSISTDNKKERWTNWLNKNKTSDYHSFIPKGQGLMNTYQVKTLPRYILIDPQGKIVAADALRPSQNVKAYLQKLLR